MFGHMVKATQEPSATLPQLLQFPVKSLALDFATNQHAHSLFTLLGTHVHLHFHTIILSGKLVAAE